MSQQVATDSLESRALHELLDIATNIEHYPGLAREKNRAVSTATILINSLRQNRLEYGLKTWREHASPAFTRYAPESEKFFESITTTMLARINSNESAREHIANALQMLGDLKVFTPPHEDLVAIQSRLRTALNEIDLDTKLVRSLRLDCKRSLASIEAMANDPVKDAVTTFTAIAKLAQETFQRLD